MNSNLASQLLSSVMGWDYVGLNSERPELEFMGSMKYDAYDRFMPGTRFMSSLVQWLNQFDEEDREVVLNFVKKKLVFVSSTQMNYLVDLLYGSQIRPILLKKATENLTFAGCHKHRINGLLLPGEEPSSISVTVEMDKTKMDWYDGVYSEMVSEDYPQASQFTVTNAINKRDGGTDSDDTEVAGTKDSADRQTWYFKKDKKSINVDFNVTSPTNGEWTIVAMGDTGVFTISGSYTKYSATDGTPTSEVVSLSGTSISGSINKGHPTKISLHITPGTSAVSGKQLYFKTYVTKDGKKYSLDSETQLYDMRGYHYFVIR